MELFYSVKCCSILEDVCYSWTLKTVLGSDSYWIASEDKKQGDECFVMSSFFSFLFVKTIINEDIGIHDIDNVIGKSMLIRFGKYNWCCDSEQFYWDKIEIFRLEYCTMFWRLELWYQKTNRNDESDWIGLNWIEYFYENKA